jgi:hypothetical protein
MNPAPSPSPMALADALWSVAERTAGEQGFQFTDRCASLLRDFIRQGVDTLQNRSMLQDDTKVSEATQNVTRYVQMMVTDAISVRTVVVGEASGHAGDVMGENNFFSVKNIFCPCFPFC